MLFSFLSFYRCNPIKLFLFKFCHSFRFNGVRGSICIFTDEFKAYSKIFLIEMFGTRVIDKLTHKRRRNQVKRIDVSLIKIFYFNKVILILFITNQNLFEQMDFRVIVSHRIQLKGFRSWNEEDLGENAKFTNRAFESTIEYENKCNTIVNVHPIFLEL